MNQDTPNQKNVILFTTFADIPEAYSLNRVVQDQLKMLLMYNYRPTIIVSDTFKPTGIYADPRIIIERIPLVPVHNEVKKDATFEQDVDMIGQRLEDILTKNHTIESPDAVVLTHDIIYQNSALKHNFASRKIAEKYQKVKWLHWIHSATSPVTLSHLRSFFSDQYLSLIKKPFPNSLYVFFNDYSIPRVASNFNVSEDLVRVVHHPSDLSEVYGLSEDIYSFCRDHDIFSADAICVYPIRLDRGKQVEHVIKTMACLKEIGLKIKTIIADFHSTGGDKLTYRDELKAMSIDWGLNDSDLIWMSESHPLWRVEVPHSHIMALMRISNVFIMPSVSESYSLVTQEAGLNKVIAVLNFDFPPFRDIFGPNAIYRKYSSAIDIMNGLDGNTTTAYGPANASPEERKSHERIYHMDTAEKIASKLRSYKDMGLSIFLRKYRNLDYVFRTELEPLLYEEIK